LDPSLIEAAKDLYCNKRHVFTRVILPLTMPGVFAGSIQTFIPSLGLFYIADMMGGAKTMYIGNLIKNQFMSARNWPLGAALSIILIVITLVLMRLYGKVGSLDDMV
ncbi:MAG: ABC transporter permease subunit, partial [Lachnospiraceae bacterium]|nr:ABC transporter permease subunit [Lachnospiraceae bacterium]